MAERERRLIRRTRLKVSIANACSSGSTSGGVRSPLYIAELDPAKLHRAKSLSNTDAPRG